MPFAPDAAATVAAPCNGKLSDVSGGQTLQQQAPKKPRRARSRLEHASMTLRDGASRRVMDASRRRHGGSRLRDSVTLHDVASRRVTEAFLAL